MKKYLLLIAFFAAIQAMGQQQHVYQSKYLPKPDTTWVFTPKGMDRNAQLPLIFLLHGFGGNYKQWNNIMDAQKYADAYGFIIVCPDGLLNSWYLNSPLKQNVQFQSFFYEELWPDIMKKYAPDAAKIFITGLSMGGHGALTLFLTHPEKFKSAGSTSGVIDMRNLPARYGIQDLIGDAETTKAQWLSLSAAGNIEKLKGSDKPIIFDCGTEDALYKMNNDLRAKCDELKIKATYITQPGAHNKAYWTKSIKQQFEFFKAQLN